ncbi:MAG TPA: peptidoglycan DD-metalloendopeptidase family protein [Acidimicrobiia bacterium]
MIRARSTVLLVVLALILGSAPSALADPATDLQQVQLELADVERAIRAARTEASEVGQRVAAAQTALGAAIATFEQAQARVDETASVVRDTELAIVNLTTQLERLEADLARTELDKSNTETRLEEQAVALYMEASSVPAFRLFRQEDVSDAAVALVYVGEAFAADVDVFAAFELLEREVDRLRVGVGDRKAQTEAELVLLEEQKLQLEAQRDVASAALAAAQEEARAVQALLDSIRRDIAAAEQHKDGLEADAERLEAEIAALQSSDGEAPGVLSWPLNGAVTSPFGYRVHPILGVRKLHTGIDIDGSTGQPITAAADGEVILAETYGGYGRAVVIDHGGGMATLYAHQSRMAVSAGQTVVRGEVIGYVGCSGSCTGPHLHFEVRLDGVPVDPLQYLG